MRRSITKIDDADVTLEKLGPMSWGNPVSVAAAFWSVLGDPEGPDRIDRLTSLCTPESLPGWGDFDGIAELLEGHGLASFPAYPAPQVAYVKFPEDVDRGLIVSGPTLVAAKIMTLQHRNDLEPAGWRVFAIGSPVPPEAIPEPPSV